MIQHVLKKMARIHCARGPNRCKICKEYAEDKRWALLLVNPDEKLLVNPDENPMATRPMIELEVDGEMVFLPFDVLSYWDDIISAMDYVEAKGLKVHVIDEENI